jgi:hypothetical protein
MEKETYKTIVYLILIIFILVSYRYFGYLDGLKDGNIKCLTSNIKE